MIRSCRGAREGAPAVRKVTLCAGKVTDLGAKLTDPAAR
jgi:hypothetical protein